MKFVVPVPAICCKLAAMIPAAVTSFADVIVIAPSRPVAPPPTKLPKTMLPEPAVRPRVCAPATVPLSLAPTVMLFPPPTETVFSKTPLVKVTSVANEIASSVVVMLPPREFAPPPSCVNPPPATIALVVVNTPLFVIETNPPALTPPAILKIVPLRSNAPVRVTKPFRLVVPVPTSCVKEPAVITMSLRVTLLALTIVTSPPKLFALSSVMSLAAPAVIVVVSPIVRTESAPCVTAPLATIVSLPPLVLMMLSIVTDPPAFNTTSNEPVVEEIL